jgi:RNA recognition motif-containing protein
LTVSLSRQLSLSATLHQQYQRSERSGFSPRDGRFSQPSPPSKTLFVGNLPYSVDMSEVEQLFSEFGTITNVRLASNPDGTTRGFAHIEFLNKEDAIAAYESQLENPFHVHDRPLRVDYSTARGEIVTTPNHKLYFHGFSSDQSILRETLAQYEDNLVSMHFLRDRETNEPTGAGFIEFRNVDAATEVLNALNGTTVGNDQTLNLSYAKDKKRSNEGDRRGGSGWRPSNRSDDGNYSRGGDRSYSRGGDRSYSRGGY